MSSNANNLDVNLEAVLDRTFVGDAGIPGSAALLRFTNAVELGQGDLDEVRTNLIEEIGAVAALDAAAVVAIFNGLVRVADGTGIQLDDGVLAASAADRDVFGINRFAGAANTSATAAIDHGRNSTVENLFGG